MDPKSFSSRQARWAQKLSCYHFRIDYRQGKANRTADNLSQYPQQSAKEEKTFQAKNVKILHRLQSPLINASLSSLSTSVELSLLYRVLICKTYVLPQLRQFWDNIRSELINKDPYKVSISRMRLRLAKLQESDEEARRIKVESLNGYKELDGVLYHQELPFVPEAIWTEIISQHHNDPLAGHFGIDKTKDFVGGKYYWPSLWRDIEAYVKGCNICLGSKAVRHKPYSHLQSLLVPTYWWKDLSIDFVTGLSISPDWKGDCYDSILVIVDWLTKIVYYKPVKVIIDTSRLAKVILDVVVQHYDLSNSIVSDKGSLFTSKFWSLLCYFLGIKWRLLIAFYSQTYGQTKRQNSMIEAYFRAFVNFEQNDWARLLPIAKFVYNNAENASTGHTLFKLNYDYYSRMSYKKEVDSRSKSKSIDKLSTELREMIIICQENL